MENLGVKENRRSARIAGDKPPAAAAAEQDSGSKNNEARERWGRFVGWQLFSKEMTSVYKLSQPSLFVKPPPIKTPIPGNGARARSARAKQNSIASSVLSEKWKSLTEEERQDYNQRAKVIDENERGIKRTPKTRKYRAQHLIEPNLDSITWAAAPFPIVLWPDGQLPSASRDSKPMGTITISPAGSSDSEDSDPEEDINYFPDGQSQHEEEEAVPISGPSSASIINLTEVITLDSDPEEEEDINYFPDGHTGPSQHGANTDSDEIFLERVVFATPRITEPEADRDWTSSMTSGPRGRVRLVVDTSAFLKRRVQIQNLVVSKEFARVGKLYVHPTVWDELEKHKLNHEDSYVREAARLTISFVSGKRGEFDWGSTADVNAAEKHWHNKNNRNNLNYSAFNNDERIKITMEWLRDEMRRSVAFVADDRHFLGAAHAEGIKAFNLEQIGEIVQYMDDIFSWNNPEESTTGMDMDLARRSNQVCSSSFGGRTYLVNKKMRE